MDFLPSTHSLEALFLKKPEQLHLNGWRKLANLIQKQRAATGCFQQTFTLDVRPGERAFFVTEQFAFQQILRNGVAVNGDKRAILAPAAAVNCGCRHLFTSAALAQQEHRNIGPGDLANKRKD